MTTPDREHARLIDDAKVTHLWRCTDEDCAEGNMEAEVSPDWYQQNGTPVCGCGVDMDYIQTSIDPEAAPDTRLAAQHAAEVMEAAAVQISEGGYIDPAELQATASQLSDHAAAIYAAIAS
jgi:hypothetical protein